MTALAQRLRFVTRHAAAGFQYELVREVELANRDVHSSTWLTNSSSDGRLALEWFAHPFFPLVDGVARAEVPAGTTLTENAGFLLDGRVLTQRRRFVRPDDGHMERGLRLPAGSPLIATLAHPALTHIGVETRFAPDSCVIWGNDRTFSFEPYLVLDLAPGETHSWSLIYRFGVSSGMSAPSLSSLTSAPR